MVWCLLLPFLRPAFFFCVFNYRVLLRFLFWSSSSASSSSSSSLFSALFVFFFAFLRPLRRGARPSSTSCLSFPSSVVVFPSSVLPEFFIGVRTHGCPRISQYAPFLPFGACNALFQHGLQRLLVQLSSFSAFFSAACSSLQRVIPACSPFSVCPSTSLRADNARHAFFVNRWTTPR